MGWKGAESGREWSHCGLRFLQFCKIALYVLSSVFLHKHRHILSQSHSKNKTKAQGQVLSDSLFLAPFLIGL